jgi:hypothetical protein
LRAFVVLPDGWILGEDYDFGQSLLFAIEVKDTSVAQ